MTQEERELCHCSGADSACPECGGSGVLAPPANRVSGSPWRVNVFVPKGVPYHESYPTSHVRCLCCGRRMKRRKIWKHVREQRGDA